MGSSQGGDRRTRCSEQAGRRSRRPGPEYERRSLAVHTAYAEPSKRPPLVDVVGGIRVLLCVSHPFTVGLPSPGQSLFEI